MIALLEEPQQDAEARCRAILDEFEAACRLGEFGESLMAEAMHALEDVWADTDADREAVAGANVRLFDLAAAHAPPEETATLRAGKAMLERIKEVEPESLSAAEVLARADAMVRDAEAALKAGAPVGATFVEAFGKLQALVLEGQRDASGVAVAEAVARLTEVAAPYLPRGGEVTIPEIVETLRSLMAEGMALPASDDAARAIFDQTSQEHTTRILGLVDAVPQRDSAKALLQHLLELLPPLIERLLEPDGRLGEGTQDRKELDRLSRTFKRSSAVLRGASTEGHVLRQQRKVLRAAALDLRRFERRHNPLVIHPALPCNDLSVNANRLFHAGSERTAATVGEACALLGMSVAAQAPVDDATHARWQVLRGSAVAVLDYSAYDPHRADPSGNAARDESAVLDAAGPVARVAYESGWAFVLGVPTVTVAGEDGRMPFDVDLEPVRLRGDGDDPRRIAMAIQAAVHGVQRAVGGTSLAATVADLRNRYGEHPDPVVRRLLSTLQLSDALQVHRALRAVLDRVEGTKAMLVLPARTGSYPPPGVPRLFHVGAFRPWAEHAQEAVRGACRRAGVTFGIGHERLDPDVLEVIWRDLCEASYVVADITDLNPNAVFELSLAHALGRRTLVITQNAAPHAHLPAIRRVRTHRYEPGDPEGRLAALLDDFLAERP